MNRRKRLGGTKVLGQILFLLTIPFILRIFSRKRITELKKRYSLDNSLVPYNCLRQVSSANSNECISLLKELNPSIVIICGTRILSSKLLNSVKASFINIHAGITPLYRGVHGGYWALANRDSMNCGVTVHIVDKGIDTGGVLKQKRIMVESCDNYSTYPYLQTGEGLLLLKKILEESYSCVIKEKDAINTVSSRLWYHPTLLEYLRNYVLLGVK